MNEFTKESTYINGTREYERLCKEKTDGFKTYISIAVAIEALQCSDFLNLRSWECFLIPIIVIVISIIFSLMTTRTEKFLKDARRRLVEYEEQKTVSSEWYSYEKKNRKKETFSLYHLIKLTYVVMALLSVVIGLLRFWA